MYHALIIIVSTTIYILLLFLLYCGLWFVGDYSSLSEAIRAKWYLAIMTFVIMISSIWYWIWQAEAWWNALVKNFGSPFDAEPEHTTITTEGYLDIDEQSHSVTISCTSSGLIINRPRRPKVYIPWEDIKNVTIFPFVKNIQKADIILYKPEPIGFQFQLTWNARFNECVPITVNTNTAK